LFDTLKFVIERKWHLKIVNPAVLQNNLINGSQKFPEGYEFVFVARTENMFVLRIGQTVIYSKYP
jgi:hypothetical protein